MAKILVVEDNEMLQEILYERLTFRGYQTFLASDGQEGIQMAQEKEPDLILMDMSLPILDGWEATKQLKAAPNTKHIPIIALTAHAFTGDRDKSLAAGCDNYHTKPINFPQLLAQMEILLNP